ncbi:hypothetical protein MWU54_13545 [Marivita sp. S6314]|nr:hypothetical protein [Marivita sp. S6314]
MDILLYSVPQAVVDRIGSSLERLPVSKTDVELGPLLRREIEQHWCYFLPSLDKDRNVVVIVMAVTPVSKDGLNPTEIAQMVATFRGAIGV